MSEARNRAPFQGQSSTSSINDTDKNETRSITETRYQPIAPYGGDPNANCLPEGRRISRACDECRRKKIKCCIIEDSNTCKNCISYKKGCTYNTSIKKRGPPRGYIGLLENRLKRIEGLIEEMKSTTDPNSSSDEPIKPPKKIKLSDNYKEVTDDIMESLKESHITNEGRFISHNNVSFFFKKMNLLNKKNLSKYGIDLQLNEKHDYFHIKKHGSSDDQRAYQIKQLIDLGVIGPNETIADVDTWILKVTGIPKNLSDRLLKIYFAYIHPLLPVINKVSFLEEYRGIKSNFPSGPLLNAVYGASIRYIENCKKFDDLDRLDDGKSWDLPADLGQKLFNNLLLFIKGKYIASLASIQAIVITHNHSTNLESWNSCWLLNCVAVRMSQDIGLHRSSDGWNMTSEERETRRVVWWSVYILDRWFSSGTGRPLAAFDEDCDEEYPSENVNLDVIMDTMTENDQHLPRFPSIDESVAAKATDSFVPMNQPFLHLLKLSEILGRILQGLYTPQAKKHSAKHGSDAIVAYLDNALSNWRNSLPPLLEISNAGKQSSLATDHVPLLSMSGLLCLSYCTLLILLHRPFIENNGLNKDKRDTNTTDDKPKISSQSSLAICTSAAIQIIEVSERMHYRDFLMVSWGFAMYPVFTAALIHIHNSSNSDPNISSVAKRNLKRALAVVEKLCLISPIAINVLGVLKKVIGLSSIFLDEDTILDTMAVNKKTFISSKENNVSSPSQSDPSAIKNDNKNNEKYIYVDNQELKNIRDLWSLRNKNPLEIQTPSWVDGSWINQLYTPTQPTFDMKGKFSLGKITFYIN